MSSSCTCPICRKSISVEDDIPLNIIRKQGGMAVMENLTAVSGVRQLEEHSIVNFLT